MNSTTTAGTNGMDLLGAGGGSLANPEVFFVAVFWLATAHWEAGLKPIPGYEPDGIVG